MSEEILVLGDGEAGGLARDGNFVDLTALEAEREILAEFVRANFRFGVDGTERVDEAEVTGSAASAAMAGAKTDDTRSWEHWLEDGDGKSKKVESKVGDDGREESGELQSEGDGGVSNRDAILKSRVGSGMDRR